MKRIVTGLALLCLLAASPALAATVEVQVLAINDLHGRLEPPEGVEGRVGQVPAGGAEYLATHLKIAVKANPNTVIVAAGDLIGASPLLSAMFDDKPTLEAVDAMGVAVSALGNHELDRGAEDFLTDTAGGHVRYLAANAARTAPAGPFLPPTWVVETGGVKVGFIGEILHGAADILAKRSSAGLAFSDEADAANLAAAALERQGVKAIVLLIHEGGGQRPTNGVVDPNGCENFRGDAILAVLGRLSPAMKVVVSGHSHNMYSCEIGGRRLTSAGAYGRLYTALTLSVDAATDEITAVKADNRIVTRDVARDPVQTAILEAYRPRAAVLAHRQVGAVTAPIETRANAMGESALGDVVADAHLASAQAWAPGAQVAFTNSGGLRAGIGAWPAAGQAARPVTYEELYAAQPFGNRLMAVTLTGEALARLLEQQFGPNGRRNILQPSKGFTYRYRLAAPDGQHVEAGSVRINGRPVAASDKVRVVASDFLIMGGDGLSAWKAGTDPVIGVEDLEALVHYFAANSPVAPGPQDRVVQLDPAPTVATTPAIGPAAPR